MSTEILNGKVFTGLGKAAEFTEVPWAKEAFRSVLGSDPYPGTLNVIVSSTEGLDAWARAKLNSGTVITPPQSDWCDAFCYKAVIAGKIAAVIVLPDVMTYAEDQLELVAAVNIRKELSLIDGDSVEIEIYQDNTN